MKGIDVNFSKVSPLSLNLEIAYLGLLKFHKLGSRHEYLPGLTTKGIHVDLFIFVFRRLENT